MTASPHSATATSFAELGVCIEIVRALAERGIVRTFAIQELTLPIALLGQDLIGQARTGMGKTLGFGVPLLDRVFDDAAVKDLDGTPRALVVVPTRELCLQVHDDLEAAARYLFAPTEDGGQRPLSVLSIVGGRGYEEQIEALRAGADVLVGTPGRLIDLADRGELTLAGVEILVLDEADEMLDLGFLPDVERLLRQVSEKRQTMLFSATMPGPIISLARTFLNQPTHIRAEEVGATQTHENTTQVVYQAHNMDKSELISRILQAPGRGRTMIFTRTKRSAQRLAEDLAQRGFKVGAVHGDLRQEAREKALSAFREESVDVLVATDVAARGIDVDDVTHVINYQCPDDEKTYVHRIGRTGRAGNSGVAVTLVDWDDLARWKVIDTELSLGQPEPPQRFSTSPELQEELGVPADAASTVGPPRKATGTAGLDRDRARRGASGGSRSSDSRRRRR